MASSLVLDMSLLDALESGSAKELLSGECSTPISRTKAWQTMYIHVDAKHSAFYLTKTESGSEVVVTAVLTGENEFMLSRYDAFPRAVSSSLEKGSTLPMEVTDRCCAMLSARARNWTLYSTSCDFCDGVLCKYNCASPSSTRHRARSGVSSSWSDSDSVTSVRSSGSSVAAAGVPRRQILARISHRGVALNGVTGSMQQLFVSIPSVDFATDERTVWCPRLAKQRITEASLGTDSTSWGRASTASSGSDDSGVSIGKPNVQRAIAEPGACSFQSRLPTVVTQDNGNVTLSLDFACERTLKHAPNNFMLVDEDDSATHIQFGRCGSDTYMLMFNHPLSAVQAFATALTSMGWEDK